MIPKVIHYCWFGGQPLPKSAQKCIASWKKYCPDYEIKQWNEDNFDINTCLYVKEAYEKKKYAFVSDYVRLYAMYNEGGVYMDTDVEVVRNLDEFLKHRAYSGFENESEIPTGIMACEKQFLLFKEFLEYYHDKKFVNNDGTTNEITNVRIITDILLTKGFIPDGQFQVVEGFALYPRDYFCPLDDSTGKLYKTKNTATIHWFSKSWLKKSTVIRSKITRPFHRIFGKKCFNWLKNDVTNDL